MVFPSLPVRRLLSPAGLRPQLLCSKPLNQQQFSTHPLLARAPWRSPKTIIPRPRRPNPNPNSSSLQSPLPSDAYPPPLPTSRPPTYPRWHRLRPQILIWTAAGLCLAVFLYQTWAHEQLQRHGNSKPWTVVQENLVVSAANLRAGRWWTGLTYSFMHQAPLHLSLNFLGLLSFGPGIVTHFGAPAFLIGWLGGAVACAGAGLLWREESRGVGASGSLFAFMTMSACLAPRAPVSVFPLPMTFPIWRVMAATVVLSVVAMREGWLPSLGHAGHLGGMAFGAVYYFVWLRFQRRLPRF